MLMLIHTERTLIKAGKRPETASIAWALEGRAFVIKERDNLVKRHLPEFFPRGKFQSFTRKLYRWQFRQVNLPRDTTVQSKDRELVFAHPYFQRDRKSLMTYMRSVTAANARKQLQQPPSGTESGATTTVPTFDQSQSAAHANLRQTGGIVLPHISGSSLFSTLPQARVANAFGQPPLLSSFGSSLGMGNQHIGHLNYMPLNAQIQQQLILASLASRLQAQASNPSLHLFPQQASELPTVNTLQAPAAAASTTRQTQETGSGEQKDSPESEDSQERLRRAAEILFRGVNPSRQRGDPSSGNSGGQGL